MPPSATSRQVHRRTHVKADGRRLHLFGWQPHGWPVTEELAPGPAPQPHLRWHPLRGEWVGYASHRQDRTFKPPAAFCPLCPVAPGGFPGEIPFADFEIAVFENRFPALAPSPPPPPALPVPAAAAQGRCEVVVYSAAHSGSLAALPRAQRELLVQVWADRYRDLLAEDTSAFVMPFENRGEEIGVTLHHPHGQIYTFPFVPPAVAPLVAAFRRAPVLEDMRRTLGTTYDIAGNDRAVAFVPPCARFPSEVWLMPRTFHPGPWTFTDADVRAFADVLGEVVARLDGLYGRPMPYLCILYAAPKGEEAHFHFHIQFYPFLRTADRLKYLAGCEQGAGMFLVDGLPEQMAARLREVTP